MPLVSVCIPTYDYARFIGRAIESVLAQTHAELEVVVLDDASTDDTQAVVERYAGDERLRYERHERNIGLFANFNRCLEVARGEYVKVLCADDWLHASAIADALELLEANPRAGMAAAPGWLVDAEGRVTGMLRAPFGPGGVVHGADAIRVHADWGNAAGMPSNVLLRRSALEDAGRFDPAFAPYSDMHLWLKLLARHDLAWIPEPRSYLRIHGEHGHGYAYEPSEAAFELWEDMARREPAAVGPPLLARALAHETRHHLLYVAAYVLRLRLGAARRLLAQVGRHVALPGALARFALHVPRTAWEQGLRIFARLNGRLVLYDPSPRPGPRIGKAADV